MATKIVVCGDINGNFTTVFAKLAAVQEKQNFAFAIVAGNFFKDDGKGGIIIDSETEDLIKGKIEAPLPVYFTLGRQEFPDTLADELDANNGEFCPNIFALGRRGHVKTTEGISIVASSGIHEDSSTDRPGSLFSGGYTDNDTIGSCSYGAADVLVTSDWPGHIERGCPVPCAGPMGKRQQSIAKLCTALRPRYHFTTSQAFYQRPPFFHDVDTRFVTRFIALAPYGNALGEKWIYGVSINPAAEEAAPLAPGVTFSPLTNSTPSKRKLGAQEEGHNGRPFLRDDLRRKRPKSVVPSTCFFCLSNTSCEAHMIGSIGEDSYITVSKGPLTKKDTFPDLGFHGHMLIIPLVHAPTIASIPGEDAAKATWQEMIRYKHALQDMLAAKSKDEKGRSKLGAVTWEISRAGGVHNHWQFLPVPVELVQNGTIEAAFKSEADTLDYPAFMTEDDKVAAVEEGHCFKVDIWSEASTRKMAMPFDVSYKLDLQFGRRVMAKLLGLPGRVHWKDCPQDQSEEEEDVAQFRKLFEQFDFSAD